ncbi:MAG: GTP 3',8-cyclase MoaA [Deltaproteobacteria bacterium]|nr:GTP 3',8-cyclase MoaA [Deltaproteobacteria bacterium]
MIDKYNREINYLRVSITDRCNLRCTYCMPKEGLSTIGHDDILRYEEIIRIVTEAAKTGIAKVRVTGGEPLVRRGVVDFIRMLGTVRGIEDISLTTNGILLADYAQSLFEAGIKRINISLDSLDARKYARITRGGDLQAVLRGIAASNDAGFSPIKINTVMIKGFNDDEVLDFARYTIDRPYQVRFIELMPLGEAGARNDGRYLSNAFVRNAIGNAYTLEPLNGSRNAIDGPARLYRVAGGRGVIGFISPVSEHFCDSCNRLRLTADGHLRACLMSDNEVDLKEPLRRGCSDGDLQDLIRAAVAMKPRKHGIVHDGNAIRKCMKDMSAIGG